MPADTFEREIKSVGDFATEPTCAIYGLPTVNLIARENHHTADGVADCPEGFIFLLIELLGDVLEPIPPREGRDDRVTGQGELTQLGMVMEVRAGSRVFQVELPTIWQ